MNVHDHTSRVLPKGALVSDLSRVGGTRLLKQKLRKATKAKALAFKEDRSVIRRGPRKKGRVCMSTSATSGCRGQCSLKVGNRVAKRA